MVQATRNSGDWDSNSGPLIPELYCLREIEKIIILKEKDRISAGFGVKRIWFELSPAIFKCVFQEIT